MDLGLQGKKAIVFGASKGLGRATAEALAAEGCTLAICSRDAERIAEAGEQIGASYGRAVIAAPCNVSDKAALEAFLARAIDEMRGVDILVTNNGGPAPGGFDAIDDAAWGDGIDLVLMSVVRACRAVLPHMRQQGSGRIINVTSVSVKQALPGMMLSNALRSAIAGLSKALALEVASSGVLVHSVMPGSFYTDRNKDLAARIISDRGITQDQLLAEWTAAVPMARMGRPEEFGRFVAFLASDACSYSTGTCIPIEGGQIRSVT